METDLSGVRAGGFFLLPEALPAEHRPTLGGAERQRGFLAAACADSSGFLLGGMVGRCLGRRMFQLAGLAPSGQVLELLVVEETLFSGSEDKILAAIAALQHSVLEFHGIPF